MNRFRGVVVPEQLGKGDIIQFETQGSKIERDRQRYSYGYVHEIEYDARHNDEVVSVRVLPVEKLQKAQGGDFPFRKLSNEDAGRGFGLDPNQEWAVILAPLALIPKADHFGRKDGLVQRMGNIHQTPEERDLPEHIDNIGGDERMSHERYGGPREAKVRTSTWGLYIPLGIRKDRFEESEIIETPSSKSGPRRRKKADFEGMVLDIDLDRAVETLGLDSKIAKLFETPADGRVKKLTTLRAVNDLFSADPEAIARYFPKQSGLPHPVPLEDLADTEIHIGVVNGLASPKTAEAKPIADLGTAFELVTQRPQDMAQYMFISGPKLSQTAIEDITAAYEKRAVTAAPEERIAETKNAVKTAWRSLMDGYTGFTASRTIPENLQGKDGQPVWKMVPKVG